jgi:spermidine synthase
MLYHGGTAHGVQSLDPSRAREPLAYYTRSGPIGQVFQAFQGSPIENAVAIIGLGAGVMACYQQPHQQFTFYEIDPTVLRIANDQRYFTYLSDCGPAVRVVLGDARRSLQYAPSQAYGMIVLDAFSGDSIPTHLLTREALAVYLAKLAPNGLVAFHISNRYLDLHGVLGNLAHDAGLFALMNDDAQVSAEESRQGKFASWWVVMARNENDVEVLKNDSRWRVLPPLADSQVWTDDYSNIVSILRFK